MTVIVASPELSRRFDMKPYNREQRLQRYVDDLATVCEELTAALQAHNEKPADAPGNELSMPKLQRYANERGETVTILIEPPTNAVAVHPNDMSELIGMLSRDHLNLTDVIHHLIARELGREDMAKSAPLTPFGEVAAQLAAACRITQQWGIKTDENTPQPRPTVPQWYQVAAACESALTAYDALTSAPEKSAKPWGNNPAETARELG